MKKWRWLTFEDRPVYVIHYACGHTEETRSPFGLYRDKEGADLWLRSTKCDECLKLEHTEIDDLPKLEYTHESPDERGAEEIRRRILDTLSFYTLEAERDIALGVDSFGKPFSERQIQNRKDKIAQNTLLLQHLPKITSAAWWGGKARNMKFDEMVACIERGEGLGE